MKTDTSVLYWDSFKAGSSVSDDVTYWMNQINLKL